MLRETGRIFACLISCVLLVLFVPSASWSASDETVPSEPSPSSSPASESASPSPEPTSPDASSPSLSGESSGSSTPEPAATPSDAETTAPEPTATETVYVVEEPPPGAALGEGTEESPSIVRLDSETTALLLLTSSLIGLGVGARVVGSMGGR